jgi:hypothetical protein
MSRQQRFGTAIADLAELEHRQNGLYEALDVFADDLVLKATKARTKAARASAIAEGQAIRDQQYAARV